MELWGVRKQERTDFPKSRRSLKDFILIPGLVRSDGKASWAPGFKRFQCGQQTGKNIWKRSLHHQPPTTPPTPPQCQTLCGSLSCSVSATGTTRPAGLPVPCECGPHWGSSLWVRPTLRLQPAMAPQTMKESSLAPTLGLPKAWAP